MNLIITDRLKILIVISVITHCMKQLTNYLIFSYFQEIREQRYLIMFVSQPLTDKFSSYSEITYTIKKKITSNNFHLSPWFSCLKFHPFIHSENIIEYWICVKLLGALETEQYIKSVKICGLIKLNSGKGCRICTINTIHKQNIRYVKEYYC